MLLAMAAAPPSAFAGTSTGNVQHATVNGYPYEYYATATTQGSSAVGTGWVQTTDGSSAPTGYMGVYAYLCKVGYGLIAPDGWVYSSVALQGMGIRAIATSSGNETFFAPANIRLYNGNGYSSYSTCTTPYVQNPNGAIEAIPYDHDPIAQQSFDMVIDEKRITIIPAVGVNGRSGFVMWEDLGIDCIPSGPEEAVAYTASQPDVRYIPVYDEDGVAVVDEFPIYGGYDGGSERF